MRGLFHAERRPAQIRDYVSVTEASGPKVRVKRRELALWLRLTRTRKTSHDDIPLPRESGSHLSQSYAAWNVDCSHFDLQQGSWWYSLGVS